MPGPLGQFLEELGGIISGPVNLFWTAGLLGLWGLEVNETRPNLASAALWVARNQSETPSLFRPLWTQQSARGEALLHSGQHREAAKLKDVTIKMCYKDARIMTNSRGGRHFNKGNLLLPEISQRLVPAWSWRNRFIRFGPIKEKRVKTWYWSFLFRFQLIRGLKILTQAQPEHEWAW